MEDKPVFVLISGKAGSGKDTFGRWLELKLLEEGYTTQTLAYADEIKKVAKKFGWNGKKDYNGRVLLQFIGSEWGRRMINKYYWITKLECKIDRKKDFIIITDVRYLNEITYWEEQGYKTKVYRIKRDVDNPKEIDEHPSEQEFYLYDDVTVIDNNGDLEDIFEYAEKEVENLIRIFKS